MSGHNSSLDGHLAALVRACGDAVILCDAEGRIRFWNRAAERIFGYPEDEALGKSLDIIIPERLRDRHWRGYAETMRTGQSKYGPGDLLAVPAVTADGRRISIEFSIAVMRDDAGGVTAIGAVIRDVTARFEETRKLRDQVASLHQANSQSADPGG